MTLNKKRLAAPVPLILLGGLVQWGPLAPAGAQCTTVEATKLTAGVPEAGGRFGDAVALDGDLLVVGEPFAAVNGRAYVFRHDGVSWIEEQVLTSDVASFALFGWSVAVDGDVITVGAPGSDKTGSNNGTVVVFRHDGSSWVEEASLVPFLFGFGANFGESVAIQGNVLVGGAPDAMCGGAADECGSAFYYRYNGTSWVGGWELEGAQFEQFGASVDVFGNRIVVGAPGIFGFPARAYVYRDQSGFYMLEETLEDLLLGPFSCFGRSVAIDGPDILVGAPKDDFQGLTDPGSVYFFQQAFDGWVQIGNYPGLDPASGALFGQSVSVDQGVGLTGSPFGVVGGAVPAGNANLHRRAGSSWTTVAKAVASDGKGGDEFGDAVAVAVGNGRYVVGAPDHGEHGAVYVYEIPELLLEVTPAAAGGGQIVALDTCGGAPGGLDAIVVTDVAGVPTLLPLFVGTFDVEGQTSFATAVPPGLAGLTAELVSYGHYLPGVAGVSDPFTFTFL